MFSSYSMICINWIITSFSLHLYDVPLWNPSGAFSCRQDAGAGLQHLLESREGHSPFLSLAASSNHIQALTHCDALIEAGLRCQFLSRGGRSSPIYYYHIHRRLITCEFLQGALFHAAVCSLESQQSTKRQLENRNCGMTTFKQTPKGYLLTMRQIPGKSISKASVFPRYGFNNYASIYHFVLPHKANRVKHPQQYNRALPLGSFDVFVSSFACKFTLVILVNDSQILFEKEH